MIKTNTNEPTHYDWYAERVALIAEAVRLFTPTAQPRNRKFQSHMKQNDKDNDQTD